MHMLALMARRPDKTREAFRAHYEASHAPLARRSLPWFRGYLRGHPVEVLGPELPFDSVTEIWFEDAKAFAELSAWLASPAGDEIREDEDRFLNRPENAYFAAVTALHVGAARPAAGAHAKVAVFWAPGSAPEPREIEARLAALGPSLASAEHLVHDRALGIRHGPAERPEAITQLWLRGAPPALAGIRDALRAGPLVAVARIEECGAAAEEAA